MNLFAPLRPYGPVFAITGLCALAATALMAPVVFTWHSWMAYFMGLFFCVFALFKFFDLPGFVTGFAKYDLITLRFRAYGWAYPFMELGLGLWFLSQHALMAASGLTLVLMLVSGAGVALALAKGGSTLQCACLGTMLNVKLSTLSVVENFGMAAMAATMLMA